MRPCRETLHMATALLWSRRAICKRLKVGAVITTQDMRRVLSIGYNGPAKGLSHDRCTGEAGKCGCLHAEDNAINFVDSTVPKKVFFVSHSPCETCAQRIIQAGAVKVFYSTRFRDDAGCRLLESVGIPAIDLPDMLHRADRPLEVSLIQSVALLP